MPERSDSLRRSSRGRVMISGVAAIIAAALIVACGSSGEKDWLAGTWNPDKGQYSAYRYEFNPAGLVYAYSEVRGDTPELEGHYVVQARWSEGGAEWYRLLTQWGGQGWYERGAPFLRESYVLIKIDKGGRRMTSQWHPSSFAEKLDPADVRYATHTHD